jgi:hypothetical protein
MHKTSAEYCEEGKTMPKEKNRFTCRYPDCNRPATRTPAQDLLQGTDPDPVTVRLCWRMDQIIAKRPDRCTKEDWELLDIVLKNPTAVMSEASFNRMYELLFGQDC